MKHFSKKIVIIILIIVKAFATTLIAVFPQTFMNILYPVGFFLPLFLMAIAYSGIPKWLLIILLLIIIAFIIYLALFIVFLFVKQQNIKIPLTIFSIFFQIEALSYLLSLFFGSFGLGKIGGILFNIVIVFLLKKVKQNG